jgi:hypothetical protein
MTPDDLVWQARAFIYQFFADHARAPLVSETARGLDVGVEAAAGLYRELHQRHALLLEAGTLDIRMAFPFSGVPTSFQVRAHGRTYHANCAWDMLGVPAALHADAQIEAVCTESNEPVHLEITAGAVSKSELLVHLSVPFAHWYDNILET